MTNEPLTNLHRNKQSN